MSAQFYHNLGKLAKASLSRARLNNPNFYGSSLMRNPQIMAAQPCVSLSTSKKNRETIASDLTASPKVPKSSEEPTKKKKYWISQGYSHDSEEEDLTIRNGVMFFTVTMGMVLIGYIMMYMPDARYRNWSQREAYIEIARREALGLPHIDPNLVPVDNVNLPSEEELGDFEIVI